jgi:arginase
MTERTRPFQLQLPDPVPGRDRKVGVVGLAQDLGASKHGVEMGPSAIRTEGLERKLGALGYRVKEYGNVQCISMEDAAYMGMAGEGEPRLKYLEPILQNSLRLKERVERIVADGAMPIALGGDHSMALGSIAGLQKAFGPEMGLLWVDAHGDFNTPQSTLTGNIHGMPLAVVTGRGDPRLTGLGPFPGVREANTVLFGVRDLDHGEIANLRDSKVTVISTRDILERGYAWCLAKAMELVCDGVERFHLSFDMDSIDPMFCPGTGTAVSGGLVDREVIYLMEQVHASGKLGSLDLVEVNPALDHNNKTARFAVELICRALGLRTS